MAKSKYYVVWNGRTPGVFETWDECKRSVEGYPDPKYKSFENYNEAVKAYNSKSSLYIKRKPADQKQPVENKSSKKPDMTGVAVDAACSGNPGMMEYRGVDLVTGDQIFHRGPYFDGTNNIGEFLAIVHALAFLKKLNSNRIIYTDSMTALSWVKNKKANTKNPLTSRNADMFDLIRRAETWLKENSYFTPVIKWDTDNWGENPADFGRK
ncbi:MAG: ribonuclease H family protein [Bacteroidota bacterium]